MSKSFYSIACALSLLAVGSAKADDGIQFFLGGSAGISYTENSVAQTTGNAELEELDTGFKVYGGVQFNDYIGLEMYVAKFGGVELAGDSGDGFIADNGTAYTFADDNTKIASDTFSTGIAPVLGVDVTDWFRPYVKAGFHYWIMDVTGSSMTESVALQADGVDPFFGIGMDFNIYEGLNLRTEYEYFVMDDGGIDYLSAGAYYQF